jgi:hypothetical protein
MRATHATEYDELKAWVDAVRVLPRFLRTKEARALFDELDQVALQDGMDFAVVSSRIGRTADSLRDALRKCPFGL